MSKTSKILILVLIVAGMLGFGLPNHIFQGVAQEELRIFVKEEPLEKAGRPLYAPDEIVVKFKPGVAKGLIEKLLTEQGASEKYESRFAKFKVLKIPATKTVPQLVEVLKKSPVVEYAEPNFIYCALWYPNDLYYQYQWHFDDNHTKNPGGATSNPYGGTNGGGIRMEEAWPITSGTSTIIVAIVDTGVAYENYPVPSYESGTVKGGVKNYLKAPDLVNTNFVAGYDFVHNDTHPNDNNSHGTHLAGTIAQTTNNTTGVAGIAYNTSIMPVKVLDQAGCGYLDDVADGINFATVNGAKIINLSLGGPDSSTIKNTVISAYNSGVTVVAACGNSATSTCDYPAAYDAYVIAVGATRYDETLSYYSSYGPSLDLAAPGGDTRTGIDQNGDGYVDGILQNTFSPYIDKPPYCVSPSDTKADPTDFGYWFYQGTSMAAPHVSGVAALLLAQNPSRTPDEIRNILQTTAEDKGITGWDQYYGWGIVDAYAALNYTPVAISLVSATTSGSVEFGILPLESTQDTTPSGIDDVETVRIDIGPANLAVKSTEFSGGTNVWSLGSTNGANQVRWEFASSTAGPWTTFTTTTDVYSLAAGLATDATSSLYLRITMPTETSSSAQYSSTITIVATAP